MRKLFIAFFGIMIISPTLFAQWIQGPLPGLDALIQSYKQEYSALLQKPGAKDFIKLSSQTLQGEYYTVEQLLPGDIGAQEDMYAGKEKRVTNTYNEVTIHVPEGYQVNKLIKMDYGEPCFFFLRDRSIELYTVNAKENDSAEISFKLDYDIIFDNTDDITCFTDDFSGRAMTLKIRYSPKYFDFKEIKVNEYNYALEKEIKYKGKKIELKTHVSPVLIITTPSGHKIGYLLEPNFENIYKDFKFVREGYKYAAQDKSEY